MHLSRHLLARGVLLPVLASLVIAAVAVPAYAARPTTAGHGGKGGGSSTPTGNDVSWPQCGSTLPTGEAFGIVGVNDGLANNLNPCLGPSKSYPSYTQSELYWAQATASGTTAEPKASLYVNTADPGNIAADWPTSSSSADPYGSCTTTSTSTVGQDTTACAWQYGYNVATQDTAWLTDEAAAIVGQESKVSVPTDPGAYPWWLDVETANSWQAGSYGQEMNVADLQGIVAALVSAHVATTGIGVYSTSSQWTQITGDPVGASAAGSLWALADWVPGARSESGAIANCTSTSFTGGTVTVTQWFAHPVDADYACG